MFNEPLFFISDQCAVHNSYLSHQYMFNFSLLWEIINVENISTRELMAYSLTDIMSCHLLTVVLLNQKHQTDNQKQNYTTNYITVMYIL